MAVEPLSHKEIEERLEELPGWSAEGNDRITRSYTYVSHLDAADAVGRIARVQDELNHHSDLTLGYTTLTVSVSTHSVGGKVTALDFELAHRIQEVAVGAAA
ncbi:4a-hydroxytetrahydrobiopterin dehydratase [Streptomyces sp. SAJ15]|uniref:4a-hydroxytetrahydrobiopterin dehydratase n=1 Tax=Streptomyces sp. SAJ15 TaxID=2011095 RepID=UPI0011872DD0|nr:4a-hydroxytetrahydrobiopterin dehydratase [Streptomyces sp. SAJ15]TVL92977.1 4a-hydroxytetrahydrobiopterin dehydratase [Streptomyces sp. SAJ15]